MKYWANVTYTFKMAAILILTELGKFAILDKFGRKTRQIWLICLIYQLSLSFKRTEFIPIFRKFSLATCDVLTCGPSYAFLQDCFLL